MSPSYPVRKNAADGIIVEIPASSGDGVPAGVICLWHGLLANVPSGWALCDGTQGTPDLRDRFMVGAASGADPGTTGGASSLSHGGAAVAAHAFTQPSGHIAHVVTQPTAHPSLSHDAHTQGRKGGTTNPQDIFNAPVTHVAHASQAHAGTAVDAHSAHTGGAVDAHAVTQSDAHADSRPPFYAVAFIMKV